MVLRTIEATRYVTPLREGGSLPELVEASDEGKYVLKFRGVSSRPCNALTLLARRAQALSRTRAVIRSFLSGRNWCHWWCFTVNRPPNVLTSSEHAVSDPRSLVASVRIIFFIQHAELGINLDHGL